MSVGEAFLLNYLFQIFFNYLSVFIRFFQQKWIFHWIWKLIFRIFFWKQQKWKKVQIFKIFRFAQTSLPLSNRAWWYSNQQPQLVVSRTSTGKSVRMVIVCSTPSTSAKSCKWQQLQRNSLLEAMKVPWCPQGWVSWMKRTTFSHIILSGFDYSMVRIAFFKLWKLFHSENKK